MPQECTRLERGWIPGWIFRDPYSAASVGGVRGRRKRPRTLGRQVASAHEIPRPRSNQDESPDGHARATRWKRRLRGPILLALSFSLFSSSLPSSSPVQHVHLCREPGFLSLVCSFFIVFFVASVNLVVSLREFYDSRREPEFICITLIYIGKTKMRTSMNLYTSYLQVRLDNIDDFRSYTRGKVRQNAQ